MERKYQILLAFVVSSVVILIIVLAVLLPFRGRHHQPHTAFRLTDDSVIPYDSSRLLPRPNFQPYGTLLLPEEEQYAKFSDKFAFSQEHGVGIAFVHHSSSMNYIIMAIRGITTKGTLQLHNSSEWIDGVEIFSVELFAHGDHSLKALVVSRKTNATHLDLHLLGWTTSYHWHVYKTWSNLPYDPSFPHFHRATFVRAPHAPLLLVAYPTEIQVFSVHDVEAVQRIQTISMDHKCVQIAGCKNRFVVTVWRDENHHSLVEYNWKNTIFEQGSVTRLEQHQSLEAFYLNQNGTFLVSHLHDPYTTPWITSQTWTRNESGWKQAQAVLPVDPAPQSFGLATSENNELMAVCVPGKKEECYVYRKQPIGHWYTIGAQDPDFVTTYPADSNTGHGVCISLSLNHRVGTLLVLNVGGLQLFRWIF